MTSKRSYLAILGWAVLGFISGLGARLIALWAYLALGLSDWPALSDEVANSIVFLLSTAPALFLMTTFYLHLKHRRQSILSMGACLSFLSISLCVFLGWIASLTLMNYGIDFRL